MFFQCHNKKKKRKRNYIQKVGDAGEADGEAILMFLIPMLIAAEEVGTLFEPSDDRFIFEILMHFGHVRGNLCS